MKLSQLSPLLLIILTVGICVTAFVLGDQTGQQLFPGWSAPSIPQAIQPTRQAAENFLPQAQPATASQVNTLFILLGSPESNIRATAWHISDLAGSPVFMHLLVPSARYGESFDEAFYALDLQLAISGESRRAVKALFEQEGLDWDRVVIMDLSMLAETLSTLNEESQGQFTIDPAQVLASLPRMQADPRSRPQVISDQEALWNGLCPLFLSLQSENAGIRNLFHPHATYPVCVVRDDLH